MRILRYLGSLSIIMGLLILGACTGGDSSSGTCSLTTISDSNGNPITTQVCD